MGFLLKAAFWLAVVVVLLPSPDKTTAVSQGAAPVQSGEAIGAAREFVADMGSFCERNREACDTGIAAAQQFGVKAQHGAKLLYHYIGEFTGDRDPALAMSQSPVGSAAPTHTATHTSGVSGASRADRIGTLTPAGLAAGTAGQRQCSDAGAAGSDNTHSRDTKRRLCSGTAASPEPGSKHCRSHCSGRSRCHLASRSDRQHGQYSLARSFDARRIGSPA
jgi:hypothetical protein